MRGTVALQFLSDAVLPLAYFCERFGWFTLVMGLHLYRPVVSEWSLFYCPFLLISTDSSV